jgi:autophagy-related protein 18
LGIGTRSGYYIYSCDPFGLLYAKEGEGTSLLEMLFNTSLVAHVGAGDDASSSQRCLRMINTKREKEASRSPAPPLHSLHLRRRGLRLPPVQQQLLLQSTEPTLTLCAAQIIRMNYKNPVCAIKMNRTRLVLLLETMIYIYDVKTMK